jgi:hypothetical protein
MHDEAALSAMDTLPRDKLRPEFQTVRLVNATQHV